MKRLFFFILVVVFAGYLVWRESTGLEEKGRPISQPKFESVGTDRGVGNLIGIQPFMVQSDYASEERFREKIETYLAAAEKRKWLHTNTIVVLPEYLGSWLLVANEKNEVYAAGTTAAAVKWVVFRHPFGFLKNYLAGNEKDRLRSAVFRMKGEEMALIYSRVFSTLSRKYQLTIVAGSILLPDPMLDGNGNLTVNESGSLYNISVVFGPDGKIQQPLVRKIFPVDEEMTFINKGDTRQLPVFETPAGRLGVLVCADSWYPRAYDMFRSANVKLLAIPSDIVPDKVWAAPWGGYNPGPLPAGADSGDVGRITEADAWKKYSMGGRARDIGVKWGMNVFLRGKLWDLGSDGRTLYLQNGYIHEVAEDGDFITNVWLE